MRQDGKVSPDEDHATADAAVLADKNGALAVTLLDGAPTALLTGALEDVTLRLEEHIIRIVNDDRFSEILRKERRRRAYAIAQASKEAYRQKFGADIQIRDKSLACEIYWHFYIKEKAFAAERRFGKGKLTSWLIFHMDVIDCGEKKIDNNRILWDLLSVFFGKC